MQQPLGLKVDFAAMAGYLHYRTLEAGIVKRTEQIGDGIYVDFDADAQIIAIELLAFDGRTLIAAQDYAEANELEFPDLLVRRVFAPKSGNRP